MIIYKGQEMTVREACALMGIDCGMNLTIFIVVGSQGMVVVIKLIEIWAFLLPEFYIVPN